MIAKYLVVGAHQGSILAKDTRNPVQPANPSSEDKRPQWIEFEGKMLFSSYSMEVQRTLSYLF